MSFLGTFLDAQASGQRFQQNQDELDLRRQDLQQRQQYQNNLIEDGKLARVMNILKLGGRPVNDNSVNYQMDAPARLAGVPGFMPEIQVSRPAIPGQTVTANGSQFEMPTLDDLMGRERMQKQRLGEIDLGFYGIKQRIDDASTLWRNQQQALYEQLLRQEADKRQPRVRVKSIPGLDAFVEGDSIPVPQMGGLAPVLDRLFPKPAAPQNFQQVDDQGNLNIVQVKPDGTPNVIKVPGVGRKSRPVAGASAATEDDRLVRAVMDDPAIFENLTPSAKTKISAQLKEAGFTGFGKPMGEGALERIAQMQSGIASIREMAQLLKENKSKLGPIMGRLTGANPYDDMQTARATIAFVRQIVGKALEGGVLRKEDELKYEKILPTEKDPPDIAIRKAEMVANQLERDLAIYQDVQKNAGRKVPSAGAQRATPAASRPPLSSFEGK